ncbi:polymorphic toxin-type HINT domain-containing protein, partial [Microtetraspora sp. NBRC 13810]|uniref:polymorphic toxin-type HINT domain-containing protein n=1 Tax=Microtetraspora sp. NBRC 13810 TaxID=3030990 RepID=UPI002553D69E
RRPNSFVPGTPVLMADGTSKPIEDVKVGDHVLATDPETGVTGPRPVTTLITGDGTKNLVKLTIDIDGTRGAATDFITATDEHPFWIPALREWLPAGQLQPGMWLQTSAGTHVQLTAVKKWTTTQRVHNLTVDDIHTYYVLAGATPVLVHNCGTDPSAVHLNLKYKAGWSTDQRPSGRKGRPSGQSRSRWKSCKDAIGPRGERVGGRAIA